MCAEYTIQVSAKKIREHFGRPLVEEQTYRFPDRIKFTTGAPVITAGNILTEKIFPAQPFPNSRLSGVEEEGTDLDQDIRRVYDVPLWKKSFAEHPVLVPMTGFFEPVYWGKQIGTVQKFTVPGEKVFFVAGMLIKPRVPSRPGLDGFTLLTHTATKQMLQYHQRLVTILKPEFAAQYLEPMSGRERFEFLIQNRFTGDLEVEKDRNMAKGWEKRVAQQEAKLKREQSYRAALEREKVSG
jgi:putative SOS response-associated peptidase YedK